MKKNHRIKLSTLVKSGILAFTAMASMSTMSLEFTEVVAITADQYKQAQIVDILA
ncbi:MAG: hypothetical protein HRU20_27430, partial [Pseudomonadales bacterium]|nr:hypothetical protein [Pseudomonadales bacterium]